MSARHIFPSLLWVPPGSSSPTPLQPQDIANTQWPSSPGTGVASYPGSASHEAASPWAQRFRGAEMAQADLSQPLPGNFLCVRAGYPFRGGLEPANSERGRRPRNRSRRTQSRDIQREMGRCMMVLEYQQPELPETKFTSELPC